MVERQNDERAVVRRDVDARERLLDVGRIVAVREDHAFGIGRRAGGVGDRGVVVVADRLPDFQELLAVFCEVVAAEFSERSVGRLPRFQRNVAEYDDELDLRQFGADAADLGQLVFGDEERFDFGVPQPEEQVVRLFELDREGDADGSGVEKAQFGDDPCVAALGQDGHLVARADARGGQPRTHF